MSSKDDKTKHHAKQRIYEQFARIGKALAAPSRLELLDLLTQGERSVEALAVEAHLSVANASQHLQVLLAARLVASRRDGQRIFYRVGDATVEHLWQSLRQTGEKQLAELEHVAREYLLVPFGRAENARRGGVDAEQAFEPIERQELVRRLNAGTVTLIDVRPAEEYAAAHLPGAISVPIPSIKEWARKAPRRKQVVAYCRGPYCVYALQAVAELRKYGVKALRLEDGVVEWRQAGLDIESHPAEGSLP
jgi:rhodanese-related sulfurtransferase